MPEVHEPADHDENGLELEMDQHFEVESEAAEEPLLPPVLTLPEPPLPVQEPDESLFEVSEPRYPARQHRAPMKLQYSVKGYADDVPDNRTKYLYHVSVKQMMEKYRDETITAVMKELQQMVDKDVFHPVQRSHLSATQCKKRIRSFMFMKEKFKSDGTFDKIKARLVAGGHMEEMPLMDISSPTASLEAVLMVAAIAAKERRGVRTADVPGAYLNAEMVEEVIMIIEPLLAQLLVKIKPEWREFIDEKGNLHVILKKAMYGCLESARLWYDTMATFLQSEGFLVNPVERCVFNKIINGVQCTICLYVDDLLITCGSLEALEVVSERLGTRFEGLTPDVGVKHSYLGMTFDFSVEGEVKITMEGYTESVLKFYEVTGSVTTPALPNLFEVVESPALTPERRSVFHSVVAKLLYLAKRTRPDILTAVAFLTTRVTDPSDNDWKRMERVLKYLNGTPELGVILRPAAGAMALQAFADAAYGVHADGKSHSGLCIALGDGPVFVKSAKQKIVSKSSTEAELISLSDGCSQVIWSRDFLIAQGYHMQEAVIFQDNTSTIALIKKGKSGSDRTRHIHIRYFFVKDRVASGEIKIEYIPTESMTADALTKPLAGKRFLEMRRKLLNWYY
jgi:histone deacetylase 1/2